MARKWRALSEVTDMEIPQLGVKEGKLSDVGEVDLSSSSLYIQQRNRRISQCLNPSSHDQNVSCCSTNGSSGGTEVADPADARLEIKTSMYYSCEERRETSWSSELQAQADDLDSRSRTSSEAKSRRGSTVENMRMEAELKEFFASAEEKLQKQFSDKYNYDVVKDEPLEGRYEWIRSKP